MSQKVIMEMLNWRERVTGAPQFIDTDHAYIHDGGAFDAWDIATVNTERWIQFDTPTTDSPSPYVHFRPASLSVGQGGVYFTLFEVVSTGPGLSGGDAFVPMNRSHVSTAASACTVRTNVNTSSTASYVARYRTRVHGGTGPGNTRIGASKGEPMEWVLEPHTRYGIHIRTTVSAEVATNLFWYEEPVG